MCPKSKGFIWADFGFRESTNVKSLKSNFRKNIIYLLLNGSITILYICTMMENLFLLITTIGILNTLYLSYHVIKGTSVYCLGFPDEWCKKVQYSPYSKTFGIPNPFLGLGMLLAIMVFSYLYFFSNGSILPIRFLVSFGFLFSLYFSYLQSFVIKAYCTWCIVSALVFIVLFVLQWLI